MVSTTRTQIKYIMNGQHEQHIEWNSEETNNENNNNGEQRSISALFIAVECTSV